MGDITVGYTTIKPGDTYWCRMHYGDEWDFSVAYAAGAVSASSQLTKQMRLQSSLITILAAAHLLSQQCTTKQPKSKLLVTIQANDLTAIGLNFAF